MIVASPLAARNSDILPACSFRRYHIETMSTKAGVIEASKLHPSAHVDRIRKALKRLTSQGGIDRRAGPRSC